MASKPLHAVTWSVALEMALLAMLAAVCAKVMRWFSAAHRVLGRASRNVRGEFYEFVLLLLCIPCFHASHFAFKLAYALNQRRLLRFVRRGL